MDHPTRPRLLDLFCGAGGASVGYHRAGFDVTGVDINPQPDYPFGMIQADVTRLLLTHRFDVVHASPPCQYGAAITKGTNQRLRFTYPDLYPHVRDMLIASRIPYIIENPDARPDVTLCGEMFGLGVLRHRRFELGGWTSYRPEHRPHRGRVRGWRHGQYHDGPYVSVYGNGGGKGTVQEWQTAMGIDWTDNRKSIAEAIPPAYTEWIGAQWLNRS